MQQLQLSMDDTDASCFATQRELSFASSIALPNSLCSGKQRKSLPSSSLSCDWTARCKSNTCAPESQHEVTKYRLEVSRSAKSESNNIGDSELARVVEVYGTPSTDSSRSSGSPPPLHEARRTHNRTMGLYLERERMKMAARDERQMRKMFGHYYNVPVKTEHDADQWAQEFEDLYSC
eukprot:2340625-Rhodomonas_salina.1